MSVGNKSNCVLLFDRTLNKKWVWKINNSICYSEDSIHGVHISVPYDGMCDRVIQDYLSSGKLRKLVKECI